MDIDVGGLTRDLVYNNAGMAALFLAMVFLCILAFFAANKIKKGEWLGNYPVKARIWENRAGHFTLAMIDKARARKDPDLKTWVYELKKKKVILQAIPFEYINPDNSVDLLALNRDEYHPLKLISEEYTHIDTDGTEESRPIKGGTKTIKVIQKAKDGSASETIKTIRVPKLRPVIDETFKHVFTSLIHKNYMRRAEDDFMQKYGGLLTVLAAGISVFLILALVLKEMGPIVDSASAAGIALANAAKVCGVAGVAP